MDDFFGNPAVQAGIAPFFVALVVAIALGRHRLAGIAVTAAFCTAYWFVEGFALFPLSTTHKLALLALLAPCIGAAADFRYKPTRTGINLLAFAAGAAALWTVWPVLVQQEMAPALLRGASGAFALVFLVGIGLTRLADEPVRAGAAALALGLGVGVVAILGASAKYGSLGISLGAGAGAFLLPQMLSGRPGTAGASFILPAFFTAGLLAFGAMMLAHVPWYAVLALALVPAATLLPLPAQAPVWLQAVLASLYGFAVAAAAVFLAWPQSGAAPG